MKKNILLLLLLVSFSLFSQSKKQRYLDAMKNFTEQYNASNYQAIFNSFTIRMQRSITQEGFLKYSDDLKNRYGNIKNSKFLKYDLGTVSFKLLFESDSLNAKMALNDKSKFKGLLLKPYKVIVEEEEEEEEEEELVVKKDSIAKPAKMMLPFKETWTVFWGGDTEDVNYHVKNKAQKNAFDFVITDSSGSTFITNGKKNEDYYAFGKEIIAPIEGEIVAVVDGIKDNKPGEMNKIYIPGNTVILKVDEKKFLIFAHFKKHSIVVKEGDVIKQGDLLGLTGNSGNSSEPHLHFHMQDSKDMMSGNGIKSYFRSIIVDHKLKSNFSPIRGEKIKNNPN